MHAIDVHDPSQVAEARRAATHLAQSNGFREEDAGRVAIVATELSTNLVKHGKGGSLLLGSYEDDTGSGIECMALDQGQGMDNISASMRDGHSTSGSPGTGLGAISRLSQASHIYSAPGLGTAILARFQSRPSEKNAETRLPLSGAVSVAMRGEEACGDSWCIKAWTCGSIAMVADGLGHGPVAAEASHAAVRALMQGEQHIPSELLATMHGALRPTRGAAVGIARTDPARGEILFAGVGNIAATIVDYSHAMRRMVSHNGIVGHIAKHMRDFTYPSAGAALMILASDGLATNWRLDSYPGLMAQHPTVIAGVLYRDFSRGRDDVTILVCRLSNA